MASIGQTPTPCARQAQEMYWTSPDATRRRVLYWPSPDGVANATILLVHGHGEHIGRYRRLVDALTELPVALIGFDQLGHGKSDGARGDARGIDALARDLSDFLPFAREQSETRRLVILGHSMGAVVTACMLARYADGADLQGAILSAPAFMLPMPPTTRFKVLLGRLMARVAPKATFRTGLDASRISRDPDIVREYQNDPLVHNKISARLGESLIDDGQACIAEAARIAVPMLVYHGTADQIAAIEGTRKFVQNAILERIEYHELAGVYHEPHNDIAQDAQKVFNRIRTWLTQGPLAREA